MMQFPAGSGTRSPLVSIVTPTLNRAHLLERTLRSVRAQTYANLEHIVMDGGSTDETPELLRQFEPTYRLRHISESDSGMYSAINKGLAMSSGEILGYLNSDDLYFPWTIETVVRAFAENPEADLVFGDALAVEDETGRIALNHQMPFHPDYVRRWGFLCQPAVFWRRRVMEAEGQFDESLKFVADCDYWMRMADSRQFGKIHEFLAVERNHGMTFRERETTALQEELAMVRSRYIDQRGARHRALVAWHGIRAYVVARFYLLAFFTKHALRVRSGNWSQLLASGDISVNWRVLPLKLVPGLRAKTPPLLIPSRRWLEPE